MKEFPNCLHRSCERNKKVKRFKNPTKEDECKCFNPPMKLHHYDCPLVKKPCPIHGSPFGYGVKEEKVGREQDRSLLITFHPSLRTERLFHPIKSFLAQNCDSATKINFQFYSNRDSSPVKHREIQTNPEDLKSTLTRMGNNYFMEKTKSFLVGKTNKVKQLKQCFHSPFNSLEKSRSQTSIKEKFHEMLRDDVKRTRDGYIYVNKNYDSSDFMGKITESNEMNLQPGFQWFCCKELNDAAREKDDKFDSDFITVTRHEKSKKVIEHNVFEIEHKKSGNETLSSSRTKKNFHQYQPYFLYTATESKATPTKQRNAFAQTSQSLFSDKSVHVEGKITQRYKVVRGNQEKEESNGTSQDLSSSEKSELDSSSSVYYTPFIFIPDTNGSARPSYECEKQRKSRDVGEPIDDRNCTIEGERRNSTVRTSISSKSSRKKENESPTSDNLQSEGPSSKRESLSHSDASNVTDFRETVPETSANEGKSERNSVQIRKIDFNSLVLEITKEVHWNEEPERKSGSTQTDNNQIELPEVKTPVQIKEEIVELSTSQPSKSSLPLPENSEPQSKTIETKIEVTKRTYEQIQSIRTKPVSNDICTQTESVVQESPQNDDFSEREQSGKSVEVEKETRETSFPEGSITEDNSFFEAGKDKSVQTSLCEISIVSEEKTAESQTSSPIYSYKSIQTSLSFTSKYWSYQDVANAPDNATQTGSKSTSIEIFDLENENPSNATYVVKSFSNHTSNESFDVPAKAKWGKSRSDDALYSKKECECIETVEESNQSHECRCKVLFLNKKAPIDKDSKSVSSEQYNVSQKPKEEKKLPENPPQKDRVTVVDEATSSSFSDLSELIKLINNQFDKMAAAPVGMCNCPKEPEGEPKTYADHETMTDFCEDFNDENVSPADALRDNQNKQGVDVEMQTSFSTVDGMSKKESNVSGSISKTVRIKTAVPLGEYNKNPTIYICKLCAGQIDKFTLSVGTCTDNLAPDDGGRKRRIQKEEVRTGIDTVKTEKTKVVKQCETTRLPNDKSIEKNQQLINQNQQIATSLQKSDEQMAKMIRNLCCPPTTEVSPPSAKPATINTTTSRIPPSKNTSPIQPSVKSRTTTKPSLLRDTSSPPPRPRNLGNRPETATPKNVENCYVSSRPIPKTSVETPKPKPRNLQTRTEVKRVSITEPSPAPPAPNNCLKPFPATKIEIPSSCRPFTDKCHCDINIESSAPAPEQNDIRPCLPRSERPGSSRPPKPANRSANSSRRNSQSKPGTDAFTYPVLVSSLWPRLRINNLHEKLIKKKKDGFSSASSTVSERLSPKQKRNIEGGDVSDDDVPLIKKMKTDKYEKIDIFDLCEEKSDVAAEPFAFGKREACSCSSDFKFVVKGISLHGEVKTRLGKVSGFYWLPCYSSPQFSKPEGGLSLGEKIVKSDETLKEADRTHNRMPAKKATSSIDGNSFSNLFTSKRFQRSTGALDSLKEEKPTRKPFKCSLCKSLIYLKLGENEISDKCQDRSSLKSHLPQTENDFRSSGPKSSTLPSNTANFSNSESNRNRSPLVQSTEKISFSDEEFFGECSSLMEMNEFEHPDPSILEDLGLDRQNRISRRSLEDFFSKFETLNPVLEQSSESGDDTSENFHRSSFFSPTTENLSSQMCFSEVVTISKSSTSFHFDTETEK